MVGAAAAAAPDTSRPGTASPPPPARSAACSPSPPPPAPTSAASPSDATCTPPNRSGSTPRTGCAPAWSPTPESGSRANPASGSPRSPNGCSPASSGSAGWCRRFWSQGSRAQEIGCATGPSCADHHVDRVILSVPWAGTSPRPRLAWSPGESAPACTDRPMRPTGPGRGRRWHRRKHSTGRSDGRPRRAGSGTCASGCWPIRGFLPRSRSSSPGSCRTCCRPAPGRDALHVHRGLGDAAAPRGQPR